ncbi:MAG: helix-turn-helix transcriptional regulator [Christensenellales bacterium]|jgi:transcriptional regulator with XRE-family HTH domain|nr:helix-turn-helix transcriptional regulator [Clostridia bacterium]
MKDNLIGKSIKVNRIAQNYTQKQLAQKIGVTHAAISYWENGVNIPNVKDCWLLADALGITIDELVGRDLRN